MGLSDKEMIWCPICDEYKIPKYMDIDENTIPNIYKEIVNDLNYWLRQIEKGEYSNDYILRDLKSKYEAMIK